MHAFYGGEADPDTSKFFSKAMPADGIRAIAQLNQETGMFECETKDTTNVKKNPNVVKADCIYL
jgi:hypothetical protein